ncbi:disease resistance protein L6-like [Cornus florida]|uniref:disease resistance protein L6-like n=1 Tax=Cornus florida TaxID=4283 RepID=UPI00289804A2|nr:disease resistance protein L6-like [Cornus florida]
MMIFKKILQGGKKENSETLGSATTVLLSSISASRFTSLPAGEYEVFLSFRTPDTRDTFADYLYDDLECAGVRTFGFENELCEGDEIRPELLNAIVKSKISIPILSKNYASSKWCLRELAQMVECRRATGQLILPIFYDVKPSDVKHQTGSYEEALREHQSCFDERTVKQWKAALREVGALEGWQVKKKTYGQKPQSSNTASIFLKKNLSVHFLTLSHAQRRKISKRQVETSYAAN